MIFRGLNLPNSSSDNTFKNRASIIMKKMNFINDKKFDQLSVSPVSRLSGNDIPLLRGCDNNLSFFRSVGESMSGHHLAPSQ